jgi:thiamine pyrophosphokinase
MRYVIIAGGAIELDFVKDFLNQRERDEMYIMACDRGYEACEKLGVVPDILIGDFDSADTGTVERAKSKGVEIKQLNPVKDDTDVEAALVIAMKMADSDETIFILGGTGSRIDHVLGNIALVAMGIKNDRYVVMLDSHNSISVIKPNTVHLVAKQPDSYVSVFPYMGAVTGVTMDGFKYPLKDATLEGFNTLTVSNEVVADEGKIFLEGDGYLIVMETRD